MGAEQSAQGLLPLLVTFFPFIVVFFVMYFLIIVPQKKRQKAQEEMISQIKKGDKVQTSGGILGTVDKVSEDKVALKIADNIKINVVKSHLTLVS